jgi:putative DNA primase/helicase
MKLQGVLDKFEGVVDEGSAWVARCPVHGDEHQSLRLAVGDNGGLLVKCRAGCDTALVLREAGLSFNDIRRLDDVDDVPRATSRDMPAPPSAVADLAVLLKGYEAAFDEEVLDYASKRFGVSLAMAKTLGLGRSDEGGTRLVVPFRDMQGIARGFQARALDPAAKVRWLGPPSPEGASWAKVGIFHGCTDWDEVVVCEGPGDALTAACAGFDDRHPHGRAVGSVEAHDAACVGSVDRGRIAGIVYNIVGCHCSDRHKQRVSGCRVCHPTGQWSRG